MSNACPRRNEAVHQSVVTQLTPTVKTSVARSGCRRAHFKFKPQGLVPPCRAREAPRGNRVPPAGLEPATRCLEGSRSIRTELQGRGRRETWKEPPSHAPALSHQGYWRPSSSPDWPSTEA